LFALGSSEVAGLLALRMRRARGVERTQLQWLLLSGLVLAIGAVFGWRRWRGPLETLVRRASDATAASVRRPPAPAPR
jgi:hypothetical protein